MYKNFSQLTWIKGVALERNNVSLLPRPGQLRAFDNWSGASKRGVSPSLKTLPLAKGKGIKGDRVVKQSGTID